MNKLNSILLRMGLVALLATTLYACGSETPSPTAPAPTSSPAGTPTGAPAPVQTSTPAASPSGIEPTVALSGTMLGLPAGAFQNSETAKFQPALPQPQQFRSVSPLSSTNLGPPKWVKPGTRITFYDAASTSGSAGDPGCTPDPNGEWEDQDGKRYTCEYDPNVTDISSAGDGLNQIDVLAVEGGDVVLASTIYSYDHTNNQFVVAPAGGWKVRGDVIDGLWIHPTRLAELANMKIDGTTVLTGEYTVDDVTYNVVGFLTKKTDSYSSYAYDTKTGLIVAATTRSTQSGKTGITIRRLRGYRQRIVPGVNGTNPAWVARTKQLNYSGTWNFTNPMDPYGGTMTDPLSLDVTLGKGGKNWVSYDAKTVIHFPSSGLESKASGVTGSSGQYWIDPKALAGLKKGQVIDRDPYTEEELVVDSVVTGGATKTVSISSNLPGNDSLLTYDRTTGALIDLQTTGKALGITILLQLENPPD